MKYDKPEVIVMGTALASVHQSEKGESAVLDIFLDTTNTAYEADE
jgi:hypothetical protein